MSLDRRTEQWQRASIVLNSLQELLHGVPTWSNSTKSAGTSLAAPDYDQVVEWLIERLTEIET